MQGRRVTSNLFPLALDVKRLFSKRGENRRKWKGAIWKSNDFGSWLHSSSRGGSMWFSLAATQRNRGLVQFIRDVPFLEASAFFDDASRGRFAFKERNLNFSYLAKIKEVPSCLFDDGLRRDKVFWRRFSYDRLFIRVTLSSFRTCTTKYIYTRKRILLDKATIILKYIYILKRIQDNRIGWKVTYVIFFVLEKNTLFLFFDRMQILSSDENNRRRR